MKSKWCLVVAAAIMVIGISSIKPTMAYFTDSVATEGMIELKLGDSIPKIDEQVENMTKKVTITNTGDYDIFVRAKAIAPESCVITFTEQEGWSKGDDGYYYYANPLAPKEATASQLILGINNNLSGNFNVIIVQEATKVLYDKDGKAYADWNAVVANEDSYTVGN